MSKLDELEQIPFETRPRWRAWINRNHRSPPGIWVVTWRKGSGHPLLAYDDIVEEALCFGWVDSKPGKVDLHRTRLLLAPRKPGSSWSRPNKQRVEKLEAAGLMAPAGRQVVQAAREDGSWTRLDDVEDLLVPDDLGREFDRHRTSRANWDDFPPSARRGILEWITTAKRPATRARRIEETARLAARGQRANQWRPG